MPESIKYILTDIEGTTTPVSFVHEVLFPYSSQHLEHYVKDHAHTHAVRECLQATKVTVQTEQQRSIDDQGAIEQLLLWIQQDRKHPALKTLQGYIWQYGYEAKAFTSQIYPDVRPALQRWQTHGLHLGVYSSGSVAAQLLLFKYSDAGDLTPFFSDYFDTAVGGKREPSSYSGISHQLRLPPASILFLSDIAEELDAATTAGMQTRQLLRPGTIDCGRHLAVDSFAKIL